MRKLLTLFAALVAVNFLTYAQTTPLSGSYVIGTSPTAHYPTFASAMSALGNGIEGAVTFQVEAGIYHERVVVPDVSGTSESNTILITSLSGHNNDVVIAGTQYGGSEVALFAVKGADYLTVENISFVPTNQTNAYGVHLTNMSRHCTIRKCIFTADLSTSLSGMRHIYTQAANVEDSNNDYLTVEQCTFSGGYIALYIGGTSYVALPKERGAIVRNNTLVNQGSKGIYLFDEADALIENNTISSAATTKSDYQAIDLFRGIGNLIIRNNKIDISQPVYAIGINIRTNTKGTEEAPILLYNNSISIVNAPNVSSYGMLFTSDCSHISIYYNSINVEGSAGRCFGVRNNSSAISNMLFYNNLLQNNTSGEVYFFRNQQHYQAFDFKHNAYYYTGTKFSNNWGDDFNTWAVAANEVNSFVGQAKFNSTADLHLQEAGNFRTALPIESITSDLDGTTRHVATPTIGCYEFAATVGVAPEMESGYPQLMGTTYNSAQFKVKYNQAVELYMLLSDSDISPSAEQIMAASAPTTVAQATERIVTLSDLTPQQSYYLYFVAKNTQALLSGITACDPFTTPQRIFPLEVALDPQHGPIALGDPITLSPTVSGGVAPYTYSWSNGAGSLLGNTETLLLTPALSDIYSLKVTDSQNNAIATTTTVWVPSNEAIATFDDVAIAPESAWYGHSLGEVSNLLYSGSYSFTNTYMEDYSTWGGFALSNMTGTSYEDTHWMQHQFRSVVGEGALGSKNYCVAFPFGFQTKITLRHTALGEPIRGVYVTNAAATQTSILNGDYYVGNAFESGDFYKVIFRATNGNNELVSLEHYLADYRSTNSNDHYSQTHWQWIDLTPLGEINSLTIRVEGSRNNAYGLTTPAYLCIDELGSPMPIFAEGQMMLTAGVATPLPLREYFDFTGNGTVDYQIVSNVDPTVSASIANGILSATAPQPMAEHELLVAATQNGITRYLRITMSATTGLKQGSSHGVSIYPIPAKDVLHIDTNIDNYHIAIYDIFGRLIQRQQAQHNTTVDMGLLPSNSYVIKIETPDEVITKRVLKQ